MKLKYVILFFIILFSSCQQGKMQGEIASTIQVDGINREYILYLPKNLPFNSPLVFVFHGFTDNASSMMNWSRMNAVADKNKFAVCYPQGLKDPEGRTFWEVGYSFTKNQNVDDVKFITNLASYLQNTYRLSSENTFATGMSNGAEMCIVLGCKAPEVFKAVAPVCGCFMKSTFDSIKFNRPVSIFMINGTNDKTTSWEGDLEGMQGWGAYLPIRSTFDFFVTKSGSKQVTIDTLVDVNKLDGSFVVSEKHTNGLNDNQVWLYTVVNGDHDWPGSSGNMDFDASNEVWFFFSQFTTD